MNSPTTARETLIRSRIDALRAALRQHGVDACLVPSADPHLSEYLPERWAGREWLSGFTGSMGTLVVTLDFAGVWADSRYWVQAEAELAGTGITLMKIPTGNNTQHVDWLAANLPEGGSLAVDGSSLGLAAAQQLRTAFAARAITLRADLDLVEAVWADRPALPAEPVYEHLAPHAATSRAEKLAGVRAAMAAHGADWHFISTLDDIAWLFNLRGSDVSYNPVFIAHALISRDSATIFVGAGKVSAALTATLAADGVAVAPYEQAGRSLAALPPSSVLLVDPRRVTLGLREQVPAAVRVVEAINPSTLAKSRKNAAEAAHVREAMAQDGAALAEFFCWFESALGRETITELTVDTQITAARARRPGFVSASFGTIAAWNANGAMPHYHATEASHATIEGDGLLLIDSGGQYLGGTTDITRVIAVGTPSAAQKRDFTLVLKGMINLSRAKFPRGTLSPALDALARAPIWAEGIEYGHGTGHGVGYFMNVHEGPQSISKAIPNADMAMEPGMITSNEPGIYRPGQWGVRIENLLLNVEAGKTEFGEFLAFETLTLCPIDTRCIDRALMRADEIAWLDDYHAEVRRRVAPLLSGAALAWLEQRTAPF
ncbi:aminopeptidase P family protein [Niveibacterium umoris]|uniref:Xaa-Pro aminopeptidase n=1 Tax=Niveibacterium umoris TaxID=1193620 RepID=A0A840BSP6_9RHOO|nr:aminopeptidase P family protein [Niveibacterium umoris]MBB4014548.1 Xaa-Pro aminopeptidase [Niveibacterium umoris]